METPAVQAGAREPDAGAEEKDVEVPTPGGGIDARVRAAVADDEPAARAAGAAELRTSSSGRFSEGDTGRGAGTPGKRGGDAEPKASFVGDGATLSKRGWMVDDVPALLGDGPLYGRRSHGGCGCACACACVCVC
jgi:hypothetical protein